jgi:hypothetical protein
VEVDQDAQESNLETPMQPSDRGTSGKRPVPLQSQRGVGAEQDALLREPRTACSRTTQLYDEVRLR